MQNKWNKWKNSWTRNESRPNFKRSTKEELKRSETLQGTKQADQGVSPAYIILYNRNSTAAKQPH